MMLKYCNYPKIDAAQVLSLSFKLMLVKYCKCPEIEDAQVL